MVTYPTKQIFLNSFIILNVARRFHCMTMRVGDHPDYSYVVMVTTSNQQILSRHFSIVYSIAHYHLHQYQTSSAQ